MASNVTLERFLPAKVEGDPSNQEITRTLGIQAKNQEDDPSMCFWESFKFSHKLTRDEDILLHGMVYVLTDSGFNLSQLYEADFANFEPGFNERTAKTFDSCLFDLLKSEAQQAIICPLCTNYAAIPLKCYSCRRFYCRGCIRLLVNLRRVRNGKDIVSRSAPVVGESFSCLNKNCIDNQRVIEISEEMKKLNTYISVDCNRKDCLFNGTLERMAEHVEDCEKIGFDVNLGKLPHVIRFLYRIDLRTNNEKENEKRLMKVNERKSKRYLERFASRFRRKVTLPKSPIDVWIESNVQEMQSKGIKACGINAETRYARLADGRKDEVAIWIAVIGMDEEFIYETFVEWPEKLIDRKFNKDRHAADRRGIILTQSINKVRMDMLAILEEFDRICFASNSGDMSAFYIDQIDFKYFAHKCRNVISYYSPRIDQHLSLKFCTFFCLQVLIEEEFRSPAVDAFYTVLLYMLDWENLDQQFDERMNQIKEKKGYPTVKFEPNDQVSLIVNNWVNFCQANDINPWPEQLMKDRFEMAKPIERRDCVQPADQPMIPYCASLNYLVYVFDSK